MTSDVQEHNRACVRERFIPLNYLIKPTKPDPRRKKKYSEENTREINLIKTSALLRSALRAASNHNTAFQFLKIHQVSRGRIVSTYIKRQSRSLRRRGRDITLITQSTWAIRASPMERQRCVANPTKRRASRYLDLRGCCCCRGGSETDERVNAKDIRRKRAAAKFTNSLC